MKMSMSFTVRMCAVMPQRPLYDTSACRRNNDDDGNKNNMNNNQ